jgi:hypothetical protein
VSRSIAAGNSASSQPWWSIVPFQLLLVSPVLAPVWIAGLVRLFRDPGVRAFRFFAWAWVVLAVVFMASRGKPYYLAGLLPALLGAGAVSVEGWLDRGRRGLRRAVLAVALVGSALVSAIISLPLVSPDRAGGVVAVNPDVGETIGWPRFASTVARVYRVVPGAVILTSNYGEAGAIDRYGPALGLPHAYSGHNAFGDWGPPPNGSAPVVAVGLDRSDIRTTLRDCRLDARIDDGVGIDNEEQDASVDVCRGPRRPWSQEWPAVRHLG